MAQVNTGGDNGSIIESQGTKVVRLDFYANYSGGSFQIEQTDGSTITLDRDELEQLRSWFSDVIDEMDAAVEEEDEDEEEEEGEEDAS